MSHEDRKPQIFKHKLTQHHRLPRSRGGDGVTPSGRDNISIVKESEHRAYHHLFENGTPDEVAKILTDRWIDPDWEIIARPRKRRRSRS